MSALQGLAKFGIFQSHILVYISLVPRPSDGEEEGRPGTHCMHMHHHSPDFGEFDYVWIYCLYTFMDVFTVNIRKMRCMGMQCVPGLPSSSPSEGLGTRLCVYIYDVGDAMSIIRYMHVMYINMFVCSP